MRSATRSAGPKLLAITHVSNVLGTENPLAEISALAHDAGALVLADGAQAAPKLPLDVAALGVDFYALTGHKLYAPTGIGALWTRLEVLDEMPPFLGGGSMIRKVTTEGTTYADVPARFEAGTPAITQAIGMAAALRWLDGLGMDAVLAHEREIADYALERLDGVEGLTVFGPPRGTAASARSRSSSRASTRHDVAEILDRHGVAVRAGHHCAQPLMERLGVAATARAAFGVYTTPEEIDRLVEASRTRGGFSGSAERARANRRPTWTSFTASRSSSTTSGRGTSAGPTSSTSSTRTRTRSAETSSTSSSASTRTAGSPRSRSRARAARSRPPRPRC